MQLDPGGLVTRELVRPDHPAYSDTPYEPTAVDLDDDGTIWVADGYGAQLVHRYAPDETLVVDRRRPEPEIYVADRGTRASRCSNSPHAVAADSSGQLYVTEWLAGGRYTKLTPR